MKAEPVLPVGAILGEGPVWAHDALWFVDIKGRKVFRHVPGSGKLKHWTAPDQIGWVLPTIHGDMIAGVKTGLHRFDPGKGEFTLFHRPEAEEPGNRLNDASTDCHGRIWFGSMDDGEEKVTGRLYSLANGHCAVADVPPVCITNGPAITPDGQTLFHTDTLGKRIWRVSLDEAGGVQSIDGFIEIEAGAGWPDGSVIDSEDCLWVALFGGWGVRRYDTAGQLMTTVRFPVSNVTKVAFGGADLCTAYATTARKGLDAGALAEQPLAGHVFAFDAGVAGLPVALANV